MIAFLANRPALQVGSHQIFDYNMEWLDAAIQRAAAEAEQACFPFSHEIRNAVSYYLEHQCPLQTLSLEDLFVKIKHMLSNIGWENIAEHLHLMAPPITISLVAKAQEAGDAYELAFFKNLRLELIELQKLGVEEIHFTGLQESSLLLSKKRKINQRSKQLAQEIEAFLHEATQKKAS